MTTSRQYKAKRRSGWAGVAGVSVALGATELFAGMSDAVPSAISAIGAYVIDVSPPWLKTFAISAFGLADKAVLAISIFVVSLVIGWFLGKASVDKPLRIIVGFAVAGIVGIAAQMTQPGVSGPLALASTSAAMGIGIVTWFGVTRWVGSESHGVTDNDVIDISRRRLMLGLAGAATVTVVAIGIGRGKIRGRAEAQRAALILPDPVEVQLDPTAANDFGLSGVAPVVVGNAAFYRIDTALVVPTIDPAEWTLTVKGMVDNEIVLGYDDIASMPLVERYATLSCVSNEVGGNLVGSALWTGVFLRDILDMAGVQPGADQIVGRSIDGFTAGFPTEFAFDDRDAMVVIGMNREVLPAKHGFPARLVVPGLYGYVSATKWLTEIELTTWDSFDGYWIPRGWSKEGPIKTQSRIDRPANRAKVQAGPYTFGGVAWAPTRGVELVEVQIDGGSWQFAELTDPLSENSWVQWKLDTELSEGEHLISVRATDATGYTQTEAPVSPRPDGAEGWHTIRVKAVSG
ncbi:MAG: molybdopterin-dependent oxidoreductase [Acidimicrobiia bacterium]|nr:MAG: molybdopterin-dependent oxidoreductase [Acidimicrobiia bacterium]